MAFFHSNDLLWTGHTLWSTNMAMEHHHPSSIGKSTINGPFSIAMYVYQRVLWTGHLTGHDQTGCIGCRSPSKLSTDFEKQTRVQADLGAAWTSIEFMVNICQNIHRIHRIHKQPLKKNTYIYIYRIHGQDESRYTSMKIINDKSLQIFH